MEIRWYPAMTAEEIAQMQIPPEHYAWMAAHFDPKGTGLMDLPETMPENGLLILNDEIPYSGQDGERICTALKVFSENQKIYGILLDFQRPVQAALKEIIKQIVASVPCPVAAAESYGIRGIIPFIPMPELTQPPEEYFRSRKGSWLEVYKQAKTYRINCTGCDAVNGKPSSRGLSDSALCVHYDTVVNADYADFTLWRDTEDHRRVLEIAQAAGIDTAVGLYQELGTDWIQK